MSCEPASLVGVGVVGCGPRGIFVGCWLGGLVGVECLSVVYGWCALWI